MIATVKPILDVLPIQSGDSGWLNGIVLVSGLLVLAAAAVAEWRTPREQTFQKD